MANLISPRFARPAFGKEGGGAGGGRGGGRGAAERERKESTRREERRRCAWQHRQQRAMSSGGISFNNETQGKFGIAWDGDETARRHSPSLSIRERFRHPRANVRTCVAADWNNGTLECGSTA